MTSVCGACFDNHSGFAGTVGRFRLGQSLGGWGFGLYSFILFLEVPDPAEGCECQGREGSV